MSDLFIYFILYFSLSLLFIYFAFYKNLEKRVEIYMDILDKLKWRFENKMAQHCSMFKFVSLLI